MCRRSYGAIIGMMLILAASVGYAKGTGALGGNIYFSAERIKDQDAKALARQFAKQQPKADLARDKEGNWRVTLVAFFRKPSVNGPMTLWVYDKADKEALKAKEPVHVTSVNNASTTDVFVHELDFDSGSGFNKNHTYLVWVGQIIAKRERVYAKGEVSLK